MAKTYKLSAIAREKAGKGASRAVRREGNIPAIIYGGNEEPVKISLEEKDVIREVHSGNLFTTICEIDLDGTTHKVLGRDVQLHPVTDRPVHADFLRVTDRTRINVMVPVSFVNEEECPGIRNGGVLNVVRFEVEVVCRATLIPDELVVDLSGVEVGDSIPFSAVELPDGVTPTITDRDFVVATMTAPSALKSAEAEEGEEGEDVEGAEGEATAEGEDAGEDAGE